MLNRRVKNHPDRQRGGVNACLSLFVVLVIGIGIFGDMIHQHGELYSKRSCTVCLNSPHLNGEISEEFQELPGPEVSFSFVEIVIDLRGLDRIASNTIRAPPTA